MEEDYQEDYQEEKPEYVVDFGRYAGRPISKVPTGWLRSHTKLKHYPWAFFYAVHAELARRGIHNVD
jgi:hypothetical protein